MSIGTLTFGSLARLNDYRSTLTPPTRQGQSKATPISSVSPLIPTGTVDNRTEQALQLSGLRSAKTKNETSSSPLFDSPAPTSYQSAGPALDFAYNFASIKGILAYRDALVARGAEAPNPPTAETPAQDS